MSRATHRETELPASSPAPSVPEGEREAPSGGGRTGGAPVFVYLAIMFAAAFLLLLMAYLMQEHTNRTVIADLQQSLDTSRDSLTEENQTLRTELESLLRQVDTLQDRLESSESSFWALQDEHSRLLVTYQAVLTLESLEHLCSLGQTEAARSLLDRSADLAEVLAQADRDYRLPSGSQSDSRPPGFAQRLAAVTALLDQPPAPSDSQ